MRKVSIFGFLLMFSVLSHAVERFVSFERVSSHEMMCLSSGGVVRFDQDDYTGVSIALGHLRDDMEKVFGKREAPIVVGTLGKSRVLDSLMRQDASLSRLLNKQLKRKTEKYIVTVVRNKRGSDELLIAGSDKRGTIYGIYELSRQLGVSPWYWWADVPVVRHPDVYIYKGVFTDGEPSVRYRGIFINDEWPSLGRWATSVFGGFNHQFYEKVFELILRLRGNFMWPAMWNSSFYADDSLNSQVADDMGVCVGTSHHEPLGRAHKEWTCDKSRGPWNFDINADELKRFWADGVRRMRDTEDVLTIGMRGNGDEPMGNNVDVSLLERVVACQRDIIAHETGRWADKTPQVWALYKEVQEYYDKGMRVPDDVILLLCDDNWGNVRVLPRVNGGKGGADVSSHKGGYGMYYHVDYVGGPRNYKWINVTQVQRMWEQMLLTYQSGVDKLWILNVGDIKPMELPIDFWFTMAWNPSRLCETGDGADVMMRSYVRQFCAAQFGEKFADEAARILNLQCKYAGRVTPELLNKDTYNLDSGEWDVVLLEYKSLESDALSLFLSMDDNCRDAFQELVLFPVRAMSNLYDMYYSAAKNAYYASRGDVRMDYWAEKVRRCFQQDSSLCAEYNHVIADGKWNHMMDQTHIGYFSWQEPLRNVMPEVIRSCDAENVRGRRPVYYESDGVVSMEASRFYSSNTESGKSKGLSWTVVSDYGKTDGALTLMPYTGEPDGECVTYRFHTEKTGLFDVYFYLAPTYPFNGTQQARVDVDGRDGFVVSLNEFKGEQNYSWESDRINICKAKVKVAHSEDGMHSLTITPLNRAIVLEKIEIDFGGKRKGYLGSPESPVRFF